MAESYDSSISRFLIIPYLKYVDYISRLCFKENLYNFFLNCRYISSLREHKTTLRFILKVSLKEIK